MTLVESIQAKPFLDRSVTVSAYNATWGSVERLPLKPGNHLTPTNLKLECYSTNGNYSCLVRYVLHYADGTSYESRAYETYNSGYKIPLSTDIPAHSSLRGTVTKVTVQLRRSSNAGYANVYGRVTVGGHETAP